MEVFNQRESEVRSYIRAFPTIFVKSKGTYMYDVDGKKYLDFFAGAGTLNYGHNNDEINQALIKYLQNDGIVHGLDMGTATRKHFHESFEKNILKPRKLNYKLQFTGPTGANCVEASLKLARLVTKRRNIIAFTASYHGLSQGALSITAGAGFRNQYYTNTADVTFLPFDGYFKNETDAIGKLRQQLSDPWSGIDLPAAIIIELIQIEGGCNFASVEWAKGLEKICKDLGILFICDEIQTGNGRTGTFFSFEHYGLSPDIVLLSKAIGGGLPLAVLMMKPEIDKWRAGEHTGTFRANNLALVSGVQMLKLWGNKEFENSVFKKGKLMHEELLKVHKEFPQFVLGVRGRGLLWAVDMRDRETADWVSEEGFKHGLIIETCGGYGNIMKIEPPLTLSEAEVVEGVKIVRNVLAAYKPKNKL